MVEVAVLSGLIVVVSLLFFVGRIISLRLFFGYATIIDVTFTVLMFIIFEGTLVGALTATVAVLFLSLILTGGRYFIGYSRISFNKRIGFFTVDISPKFASVAAFAKEKMAWQRT